MTLFKAKPNETTSGQLVEFEAPGPRDQRRVIEQAAAATDNVLGNMHADLKHCEDHLAAMLQDRARQDKLIEAKRAEIADIKSGINALTPTVERLWQRAGMTPQPLDRPTAIEPKAEEPADEAEPSDTEATSMELEEIAKVYKRDAVGNPVVVEG